MNKTKQMTRDEAVAFYVSRVYERWTARQIVDLQLFQDRLCVPFGIFQKAISEVLGRQVYTHEFASQDELIKEYLGEREPTTLEEIIGQIPEDKRILIFPEPLSYMPEDSRR